MANLRDKLKALASFKGVDLSDITYEGDMTNPWDEYEVDGESYIVCTEDEADQLLKDDIESFIDDQGLLAFTDTFNDWIINNAMDQYYFDEVCSEYYSDLAYDYEYESGNKGATRLIDECLEEDLISEDELDEDGNYTGNLDLAEEYSTYMYDLTNDRYSGDFVEWYRDEFGEYELEEVCRHGNIDYDLDAIVEELKSWDGYGNNLARYDGEDNEVGEFHIFRQN